MKIIKVEGWHSYITAYPDCTGCLIDGDGDKAYYRNGICHREDGPAIEGVDGYKAWYLNNVKYKSEEDWKIAARRMKIERILKTLDNEKRTL